MKSKKEFKVMFLSFVCTMLVGAATAGFIYYHTNNHYNNLKKLHLLEKYVDQYVKLCFEHMQWGYKRTARQWGVLDKKIYDLISTPDFEADTRIKEIKGRFNFIRRQSQQIMTGRNIPDVSYLMETIIGGSQVLTGDIRDWISENEKVYRVNSRSQLYVSVFFCGILLLLLFFIVKRFDQHIFKPLYALREYSRKISSGEYDIPEKELPNSEITEVFESFYLMSRSVRKSIENIDKKKIEFHGEVERRSFLEKENKRLRLLLEQSDDLVSMAKINREVIYMNAGGLKLLKIDDARLKTMMIDHIHPHWVLEMIAEKGIPVALQTGFWKGESAVIDSEGKEIPVMQTIMSHESLDTSETYLSTIMHDISQLKKNEKDLTDYSDQLEELVDRRTLELQRREEEYRNLYENSMVGLWRVDLKDGSIIKANEKAAIFFGHKHVEEIIGQPLFGNDYFLKKDKDNFWVYLESHGHVSHFEMKIFKDGENKRYVSIDATIYRDKEYVEGVVSDITESKNAQKKLNDAQAELIETARMAGRAEISSSVLHNVGNVLNSVGVAASVAAESLELIPVDKLQLISKLFKDNGDDLQSFFVSPKGSQSLEYLNAVVDNCVEKKNQVRSELQELRGHLEHSSQLISIQQSVGKMIGVVEEVSINRIIKEATQIVFASLYQEPIDVVLHLDARLDEPHLCDKHKVLQILINLVSNAKHAVFDSGREDKSITISSIENGSLVSISVEDNGVGIKKDAMDKIFTLGFTTKKEGHGFGLHSCANTAKELGGEVQVESDGENLGARFTLVIPKDMEKKEVYAAS